MEQGYTSAEVLVNCLMFLVVLIGMFGIATLLESLVSKLWVFHQRGMERVRRQGR